MKIIIPMSGIGKRFIDAGYLLPKPLIHVDGMPIIQHIINLFPGEKDFIFICNDKHLKETDMRNILMNICPTGKIFEVSVNDRKGPVDAVSKLFSNDLIKDDEEIIISYCDYGTQWNYFKFKEHLIKTKPDGCIACYTGFHPHMLGKDHYAYCKTINDNVIEIQEKKPFTDNKMNEYASNGTYYFKSWGIVKKYFNELMKLELKINNEYYVSCVYNLLIENNLKVNIFLIEKMLQWGTPLDLEEYKTWSRYFKSIRNPNKIIESKLETLLILPMAGRGSRFSIVGYTDPKPLIKINNKEMVVNAVDCLKGLFKESVFITLKEHTEKYNIEEVLIKNYNSKIIKIEDTTEGQACTCEIAINDLKIDDKKPILISACDNGVYFDYEKYMKLEDDESNDVIIWSFSNNQTSINYPNMYAWLDVDENNNIKDVSVKKPFNDRENKYCIIGTMFFRKTEIFKKGLKYIYDNNIRTNNEYYVDNLIKPLIDMGYTVKNFTVDNYLCWGTPNDLKTFNYWNEYFIKDF